VKSKVAIIVLSFLATSILVILAFQWLTSEAIADDESLGIVACVRYDCKNCEWNEGDKVDIYYKPTLQSPDPEDPEFTKDINFLPAYPEPCQYRANIFGPIDYGYYKAVFTVEPVQGCQRLYPLGGEFWTQYSGEKITFTASCQKIGT